ncbi:MAG: hypothetical protein NTZ94_05820 [Verrucomicrobia bacterium]|nr:hypothetical protein [Verrucomicrobiota bacterium]
MQQNGGKSEALAVVGEVPGIGLTAVLFFIQEGTMLSHLRSARIIACSMMGVALFFAIGGHFALLQGIAWTSMLRDFSRSESIATAIDKIVDGKHPCGLCKKIAAARQSQSQDPLLLVSTKKFSDFITPLISVLTAPLSRPLVYARVPAPMMEDIFFSPPVPVPIFSC